jgi:hypothetical protein
MKYSINQVQYKGELLDLWMLLEGKIFIGFYEVEQDAKDYIVYLGTQPKILKGRPRKEK